MEKYEIGGLILQILLSFPTSGIIVDWNVYFILNWLCSWSSRLEIRWGGMHGTRRRRILQLLARAGVHN